VITSSIADLAIIPTMAVKGILMASLPMPAPLGVFAASLALALVLDQVKVAVFSWLRMV
jgi:H+-transporting ATPase